MVTAHSIAGVSGALAIMAGAFGAHALRGKVEDNFLNAWNTAAQYHLIHSVALLLRAPIADAPRSQGLDLTSKLFVTGITLFSGSIYLMVLTGQRKLGMITPFGGFAFIFGWGSLLWAN